MPAATTSASLVNIRSGISPKKQYLPAIQAGLVEDVDAAIAELLEKAEEAGLSKVREAYTKQWLAYVEEMGIAK